jgi:hypothetical protein
MSEFVKTEKQRDATRLMSQYVEVLLEGGSRSGKTFIEIRNMIMRGLKCPGSRHLVVRNHFNHAKITLWKQTIPDVLKIAFPDVIFSKNLTDYYIKLENESQLWIGGTDDKERTEKILGSEWATIFLNEISQMPYGTYELLKTRLNPPKGLKPLLLLDQNPPSRTHWSYIRFHTLLNPENKQPLSDKDKSRQTFLKMNPADNLINLSDGYIDNLESMSEGKKRRFLYGEYGDDSEFALWRRQWIIENRVDKAPETLRRIVVAVDPATTGKETSDDTGIIVVGMAKIGQDDHYYVLADKTYHGDVTGWGQEVVAAYKYYKADKVIGETNNGGDLVEMNIRNYDRNISFKSVHASRGKAVRAEPIADLYRRGFVHHVGEFTELEDQQTSWTIDSLDSPNNMDALVWGISYMAQIGDVSGVIKLAGW